MENCQFITGIFVQHSCTKPALDACSTCGTEICMEHRVAQEDGHFCYKCAPVHDEMDEEEIDLHVSNSGTFGAWYWLTRGSFHQHTESGPHFDQTDFVAFDTELGGESAFDGAGDADSDDFFES